MPLFSLSLASANEPIFIDSTQSDPSDSPAVKESAKDPAKETIKYSFPWSSQNKKTAPPPKPFTLPTYSGEDNHQSNYIPPLQHAPRVDGDSVFYHALECYPSVNRWRLDLTLEARLRTKDSRSIDALDGTILGSSYAGLVASLPLYSATEEAREREREYMRRIKVAGFVAAFVQAIADRNHALRELGLYSSLEARSRVRVKSGITTTDEQVTFLEKVAAAQKSLITSESQIMEHRLALVGGCEDSKAEPLNVFLTDLAQVPSYEGRR